MATEARGDARQAFRIAPNAFLTLDASGRVLYANPQAEELFGYEPGEILGLSFGDSLTAEPDRELVSEGLSSLTVGGQAREVSWRLNLRARSPPRGLGDQHVGGRGDRPRPAGDDADVHRRGHRRSRRA
jgi:PAS domain-containing protein